MIRLVLRRALPGIGGLIAVPWMPWQACLALAFCGLAAYICRMLLIYRLASKAMDKASPEHLPAILSTLGSVTRTNRAGTHDAVPCSVNLKLAGRYPAEPGCNLTQATGGMKPTRSGT